MRWLAPTLCAMATGAWIAAAQTTPALLPSPVRLAGIVTDSAGQPVPDVWICHSGLTLANTKTDSRGRFDLRTRAPAIVFRKGGSQSKYLRVADGNENPLTIVLAGPPPQMKACLAESHQLSLRYFGSAFGIPKIRGVSIGKQSNDVDYGCRAFWIATPVGKAAGEHCSGAMWGSGWPLDDVVWASTEYRENSYQDHDGGMITDARGRSADGTRWRVLGHWAESVSYRGVSERDAAVLDQVIDDTCVMATRFGLDRPK